MKKCFNKESEQGVHTYASFCIFLPLSILLIKLIFIYFYFN